jgi:hypothetical protein
MVKRKTLFITIGIFIVLLLGVLLVTHLDRLPRLTSKVTVVTKMVTATPEYVPTTTQTAPPKPTITSFPSQAQTRPEPGSVCAYDPLVATLMTEFDQYSWVNWIESLSGEKPVTVDGESVTIKTRFTENLFNGDPDARAFDFVVEQMHLLGYEDDTTLFEESYKPFTGREVKNEWKNLIVVIPGADPELAQEEILLTAHLDSITGTHPEESAPGADDNATGIATLMEAARILRNHSFKHTIKLVFFTGEERGLQGSKAYVIEHYKELENIIGVLNLDMFGYDADDDHCFEMHVGEMPKSNLIGGCLADIIDAYNFNIKYDYLTTNVIGASDHASFWMADIGAILVLENFETNGLENGCGKTDKNPHYHTKYDLIDSINLETSFPIAEAAILTAASLGEPIGE